jgi:chromosomal replication initiator protein
MTLVKRKLTIAPWAIPGVVGPKVTAGTIVTIVSVHTGVSINDMLTRTRKRKVSDARQMTWYFIKKYTGQPFAHIGELFGRDHATVYHGIKAVNCLKDSDANYRRAVDAINADILAILKHD